MLSRECAGGIVFHGDKVLMLYNEKNEWVFPKGVIKSGQTAEEVALSRVQTEANIRAEIVSEIGESVYEFYSLKRQRMVRNHIRWFCMQTSDKTAKPSVSDDFFDGGFYSVPDALEMLSHSKSKSLMIIAYQQIAKPASKRSR